MKVRIDGVERAGRAVEVEGVDSRRLATAVRSDDGRVVCPDPTPAHEYVGCIRPDTSLPLRAALAAAARTRGLEAPEDDEIADLEAETEEVDVDPVDLAAARERVAEAGTRETELRERVARLGGKVEARREGDGDAEAAAAALREAATELSEAETERLAAEQALDAARERARENRNERARARRLADRADNLRRAARERLAMEVYPDFCRALAAVPTPTPVVPGETPAAYEGDDTSAALAVATTAALEAPVVLACGRFPSADAAAETLDCAVISVRDGE